MRKAGLMVGLALLLAACSNPKSQKVPTDPDAWSTDENLQKAVKSLTPEEQQLVARWMMRTGMRGAFGGAPMPERTIEEAIQEQKAFELEQAAQQAEQERLAAEMRKQREEALQQMQGIVTVALLSLEFQEGGWKNNKLVDAGFNLRFAIENKSDKDLAGVKGTLTFVDMFDAPILSMVLPVQESIPAGAARTGGGFIEFNQFMEEHKRLKSAPANTLKTTFTPEMFVFADGTRLPPR